MEMAGSEQLLSEIRGLIEQARRRVAGAVNAEISVLYWHIGRRVSAEALRGMRAEYGKQVVAGLAAGLREHYGRGWSERLLRQCIQFFEIFPDERIVHTMCAELSWSHLRVLMTLEDPIKREFYLEMSRHEGWSVRQLTERVQSMLFERTSISRLPEETIRRDLAALREGGMLTPALTFRDPYVLDFLGLRDTFSERDLESAIIVEMQRFIIEMGSDFAFLDRQRRITIDGRDYYIDLLFFHRRLRCLVAIELKLGEFEAGYKGQMELYLRYLERHESMEGENPPIGLILCAGKNEEHVELLQLDRSNIRVADYLTVLPDREILREKLHRSIALARQRLDAGV